MHFFFQETLNADSEGEHSQNWKLWLQENESPADLVQEKWHLSFGHRRNDIKDLHTTQVLEQWPCLLKSEWVSSFKTRTIKQLAQSTWKCGNHFQWSKAIALHY